MKKIISVFIGIIIPFILFSQDFSTYESRRETVLTSLKDAELDERGKHGIPKALARLWNDPNDEVAIEYLVNILDHEHQTMFDFPGIALALYQFNESFSQNQINEIKKDLERLAKSDKKNGEGFLGHGTENHATMMWCGAYLFAQYFPDAQWVNGMTSEELMADMKDRLTTTFKNVYDHGYVEYLSTTYEVVMNFPVEILLKYAEDPEMKATAEAFMLYKWSLLSLNNFEGNILAPYARMNTQQDHNSDDNYIAATTYYNWLMWGWGPATNNVKLNDFTNYWESTYTLYSALTDVRPNPIFFKLANSKQTEPYTLKSLASTFGHRGTGASHMMMRKVYRDKQFAIGTGNFRWVPGWDYADDNNTLFNIVWSSSDRFNYLGCFHPYWYSDGDEESKTPDTWAKGNVSPFQQSAHHKNTAIILFDIPEKEPWVGLPNESKWSWRDGHADHLIKRAMLRYPKSVDEKVESKGWVFLREGDTYIGIKPLKDYYEQTDLKGLGLYGFNIIKSDHAQTGFVFELGTGKEFGTFEKFQKKLLKNTLEVNWNTMEVRYTNAQGDRLEIQFQSGLEVVESRMPEHLKKKGINGMALSIPKVKINGESEQHYKEWPMIGSPFVNMKNSVLNIETGTEKIIVDWSGSYPQISQSKN